MNEYTIRQGAKDEPFAPDTFAPHVGHPVPDWAGGSGGARLLRAELVDDGWYALLTVDVPEVPPRPLGVRL